MRLYVRTPSVARPIDVELVGAFPSRYLRLWEAALHARSSDAQRDTVEYLEDAHEKWSRSKRRGRIVYSVHEMQQRVQQDPTAEFLGVLTASASWFAEGGLAGFCQFRRTWCNNLVFDFLAVHPGLLDGIPRPIIGLGVTLLYRLALAGEGPECGKRLVRNERQLSRLL